MRLRYVYKMPQSSCIQKNQFTYIWQHTSTYPQLSHNCTTRCQRCVARWTHSRTANSINCQVNMMYANCEAWCYNKHWIMITLSTSWIHDTTQFHIRSWQGSATVFKSTPITIQYNRTYQYALVEHNPHCKNSTSGCIDEQMVVFISRVLWHFQQTHSCGAINRSLLHLTSKVKSWMKKSSWMAF